MSHPREPLTYTAAGVNIEAATEAVRRLAPHARSTFRPEVLGDIGFFGGFFRLGGAYRDPVLVSSTDSVGTKVKIAITLGRHDTIGIDLVNHCVNDIFVSGAAPLFFLDYIGIGRVVPERVEQIVQGLAAACRATGCALIGGETAEMPDLYAGEDYDLAGFIVGIVEHERIIDGRAISVGDVLLGLPSSGLHTNGYSLARRVFGIGARGGHPARDREVLATYEPALGRTLGDALLEPHRAYYPLLKDALPFLKGMAHITGGGLVDNVPRMLPSGTAARFDRGSWPVPPLFTLIQERGSIADAEMFRVFNMGLGLVVACRPTDVAAVQAVAPEALMVGEVIAQAGEVRVVLA
ncbi:MAG: phosphoribosylformylglycinamidine cyclo-ligase [Chloroflexi bacterium]|nr:phosphoribosylformylglycinamidine cyclo-ligase [Chloroflexota bacterium]